MATRHFFFETVTATIAIHSTTVDDVFFLFLVKEEKRFVFFVSFFVCVCVCVCVRAFVFCFADLPAALVDRPSQVVDASRKRRGKGNDVVFCFVLFSLTEFLLFFFVSFFLKTNSTPPGDESTERSTSPWVSDLFQVANLKKIKLKNLKKNVFFWLRSQQSTLH